MNKKFRRVAVAAPIVAMVLTPTAALGVSQLYSYSGADFSVNDTTGRYVDACDRESDGHTVRADYQRTGSATTYTVGNGGGVNTCARSGRLASVIYRHRIVEVIPNSNDDEGSWKYPS